MDEIVNVYINLLDADGIGDFVICCDCGELALIELGGIKCKKCNGANLIWADDLQECNESDLKRHGYIVKETYSDMVEDALCFQIT